MAHGALVDKPTKVEYGLEVQKLKQELAEWNEEHPKARQVSRSMKFIGYGVTLLRLLEGPAEANSAVKALVVTFESILSMVQDSKENDGRVSAVFHAKIDMLLIIAEVNCRVPHISNLEPRLTTWVEDVTRYIKEVAKAIGVYRGECHFVQFFKAAQWKDKFKEFTKSFRERKRELQLELQFVMVDKMEDISSNIEGIDKKVDAMLEATSEWESKLVNRSIVLSVPQPLLSVSITELADNVLQDLVFNAGGPGTKNLAPRSVTQEDSNVEAKQNEESKRRQVAEILRGIKVEIKTSLEDLFEQHARRFENNLNRYTKQIEISVAQARDVIVHRLEGLSERLHDEDLRVLWKEMGWMFCVENKIFVIALFEHYLDIFSDRHSSRPGVQGSESSFPFTPVTGNMADTSVVSPTILTQIAYRSISDYLSHPDAWTLEYFINYGKYICRDIDTDYSGFIRISEANEFTDKARALGISLPKWCAYSAAGWRYELQIYQVRIHSLIQCMLYQQMIVLPENREYVSFVCTGYLLESLTLLARGPLEVSWMISEPLRELVNSKVKKQDNIMRTELQDFGYHIEPNDISQLAKKESPFESVLMQLLTALLEHCVQVFYVASKNILDYREFETINNNFYQLLNAADDRLEYLKGKLDGISVKSTESVDDFYGGMFRLFSKYNDNMEIYDTLKCNEEEIDCFIESISIVDQYELPSSPDDISNVLIYSTWESHKKSIPENTIPKKIPITWNDPEGMYRDGPDRKTLSADYHSGSFCDICQEQNGPFYTCLVCTGTVSHCQGFFDLCGKCQKENTHILNHQPEHAMYKHYKDHSLNIRMWTNGIASYFLSNQYLERQRFPEGVTCGQCRTNIPRTETWYQCMESTCSVMYVCQKCADKNGDFNDLPKIMPSDQNHYWWHTMLFLPGQVASETPNDSSVSLNKVEVVESDPLFRDLSATDVNRINEEILEIKERLGHMELVLERLCKVIEVIEEKL